MDKLDKIIEIKLQEVWPFKKKEEKKEDWQIEIDHKKNLILDYANVKLTKEKMKCMKQFSKESDRGFCIVRATEKIWEENIKRAELLVSECKGEKKCVEYVSNIVSEFKKRYERYSTKLEQFANPNPFPNSPSDPTWNDGRYAPSVPIKDRRDIDDEEDESKNEATLQHRCAWCGDSTGEDTDSEEAEGGISHGICPDCKEKEYAKYGLDDELEEAPIPFQPSYPGGKPGGIPEEEDEKSHKSLALEDMQKVLFGEKKDLLWACKKVLLDQLDISQTLKEQITYKEKEEFEDFIKSLNLEQILMILSEDPNITDEERSGLTKLGWTIDQIKKMGTAAAKAAFWNEIPAEKEVGTEKEKRYEVMVRNKIGSKFGIKTKVAIGLGIATLLAVGALFIYKRYKDQCRRQCRDSRDANCLKRCRSAAAKESISRLQASKVDCGSDQACIAKANKELKKWEVKLVNLQR